MAEAEDYDQVDGARISSGNENELSDGNDSDSDAHASRRDELLATEVPLFTDSHSRRVFEVHQVTRIVGGFRPSVECRGDVVEVPCVPPYASLRMPARAYSSATIAQSHLTLNLRYEPPSPKFTRKHPECASYRLTFLRGSDFLYSTRGLHTRIVFSRKLAFAVWGNLELFFGQPQLLDRVLSCLKHVKLSGSLLLLSNRSAPMQGGSPLPVDPVAEEQKAQAVLEQHSHRRRTHRRLTFALASAAALTAATAAALSSRAVSRGGLLRSPCR